MEPDSWLGVELRHFLALEAVAQGRILRQRQRPRSATPSRRSASRSRTLERIVGHRLVERPGGPKPVSLTEAGQLLLTHAERDRGASGRGPGRPHRPRRGPGGTLRVGVYQSVGQRILPEVMRRFLAGLAAGRTSR